MSGSPTAKKGKIAGAKKFQTVEDINITKVYRMVTSDSSAGVDHDEDAYYARICQEFANLMGEKLIRERSVAAIKSR